MLKIYKLLATYLEKQNSWSQMIQILFLKGRVCLYRDVLIRLKCVFCFKVWEWMTRNTLCFWGLASTRCCCMSSGWFAHPSPTQLGAACHFVTWSHLWANPSRARPSEQFWVAVTALSLPADISPRPRTSPSSQLTGLCGCPPDVVSVTLPASFEVCIPQF